MGSDDLFHKRKAKKSDALQRQKHTRARNQRYLIICEGSKTEPYYLNELLTDWGIREPLVKIEPPDGNSPDRIVQYAINAYQNDAKNGDPFDTVFCVFDRDSHTTFDDAVTRIKTLASRKTPIPLKAITSNPCFEVWLLLHFGFSDQPFQAAGKKSIADQVVAKLKKEKGFEHYAKGQKNVFGRLKGRLSDALRNADQLRKMTSTTRSHNPSTDMDVLVLALQEMAQQNAHFNPGKQVGKNPKSSVV